MNKKNTIILKILGVLLFIFVADEIACRFFLPAPQKIITTKKSGSEKNTSPLMLASQHLNPNRIINIENHSLNKKNVVFETNSLGYRGRDVAVKPSDPGYKRILFLGDSITLQDYLNEDETFVRLVEAKARIDNKRWETINASLGGIGLKSELAILRESGLPLQPDIVVLDFYLNDFEESMRVDAVPPNAWLSRSRFLTQLATVLAPTKPPAKKALAQEDKDNLEKWHADFVKIHRFTKGVFNESPEAFNNMINIRFNDFGAPWTAGTWGYMHPFFSELKNLSVKNNFKPVIVFHPTYYQVYTEFVDDYPQQQMKHIADELGIPMLDLLPPLRARALQTGGPSIYHGHTIYEDIFYDESHHTEATTAFVADQIYSFLLNM